MDCLLISSISQLCILFFPFDFYNTHLHHSFHKIVAFCSHCECLFRRHLSANISDSDSKRLLHPCTAKKQHFSSPLHTQTPLPHGSTPLPVFLLNHSLCLSSLTSTTSVLVCDKTRIRPPVQVILYKQFRLLCICVCKFGTRCVRNKNIIDSLIVMSKRIIV